MFKPFTPYRPHNDFLQHVISPPYNNLSLQDSYNITKNNPLSFIHIIKPVIQSSDAPYNTLPAQKGAQILQKFIQNNVLIREKFPHFYVYSQENNNKKVCGLVGEIDINVYKNNIVKSHENIIPEKVNDLTLFTYQQKAFTDPIVIFYKKSPTINNIIETITQQTPTQTFLDTNKNTHSIWTINNSANEYVIQKAFNSSFPLYIADGHHRSATALSLLETYGKQYRHVPAILFSDQEISLLSYNRIIKTIKNMEINEFLKNITHYASIQQISPKAIKFISQQESAMFFKGQWYQLSFKQEWLKKTHLGLGIEVLNRYILDIILDIKSLNNISEIECVGGHLGLEGIEKQCLNNNWPLGFFLPPVTMKKFTDIVDQGHLMPPKTTWFEPKIWTGFFTKVVE
jgi:uncharacterized protein (DUF1015 family)